ncbi:hypothetical protein GGQ64_000203 [Rhizobium azooxidifex]|uniref:Uncharacterized protein n=1 Tax=Mycoplana azooxidifex TaxID=1636188 RepID=A0A7W6D6I2_9HYPH|nr:hypothetical protein [Mycoplana azooxidifex]
MGREIAIIGAERAQPVADQAEVLGLLEGHLHPAVEEGMGHAFGREARDDVEREIDGVELDVRQRVQERDAALQRVQRTLLHVLRRHQFRPHRPAGAIGKGRIERGADGERAGEPAPRRLLRQRRLGVEIGREDRQRGAAAQAFD